MHTIRLGILQVNHDKSVEIGDKFPDDAHRFRDLFDALDDIKFRYRIYMTIGGELPSHVDEQDAYLITGSPLSVLDDHAWLPALYDFIRKCDAAQKPLLGACFGHQAIAVALGGKVERAQTGWNVGVETATFEGRGDLPLYVFHQDQVTQLPPGASLAGASAKCPIAAFVKGQHIMTTQAHPEFTDAFMRAVVGYTASAFDAQQYRQIVGTLDQPQSGETYARWAADFFLAPGQETSGQESKGQKS